MFPIIVPSEHIATLNDWYGGQWSAFYSLASTGKINSKDYLTDAIVECTKFYRKSYDDKDRLFNLLIWLREQDERT
jgi:hypothetical protein